MLSRIVYTMQAQHLIISIFVVTLSGALKLQFAYGFLGSHVPITEFAAAALIAYAAYAFDRGVENKEDEKRGSGFKKALLLTALIAMVGTFVLYPNPALVIPFLVAYLYAKGIGGYRLKGGSGTKNCIVALTWSLGILIFLGAVTLPVVLVCLFFFCKSFVNTVIYDVRDVDKDRMAGILTIPTILTRVQVTSLLLGLSLVAHVVVFGAYFTGLIAGIDVLLISSVHSTFYIIAYCNRFEMFRNALVDGEWILYTGYTILRDCIL
ncbi:MAG: UbiA prenyltransferase [Methanoculleus marisnigri]|uniref:UbiA prenyltransferase n=1 Tax=Methanoculleus marisnigri TaxID=2198 RepID=A0A101J2C2_9EURY|nr:MAG: UbiA prenyltransferase [Methanoculleus marisnigri]KUL05532.1 MAG: UbiA prenyltransferase [Methanoculleus marisnigri]